MHSPQRQTFLRWQTDKEELNAAAHLGVINMFRICVSKAVEFAIPDRRRFQRAVDRVSRIARRELLQRWRRLDHVKIQVDVSTMNQRPTMVEQLSRRSAKTGACSAERRRPLNVEVLRVVEFGFRMVRRWQLVESIDQPREFRTLSTRRPQPFTIRNVRFNGGILHQQRDKPGPRRSQTILVVKPVPVDRCLLRISLHQPTNNIETKRVDNRRAGDAGNFRMFEWPNVNALCA